MNIKNISIDKRPRERAFLYGFEYLNDYEILAIIIGSGTSKYNAIQLAENIINHYKSLENISQSSLNDLTKLAGIGKAKAIKILAIFELYKRIKNEKNFPLNIQVKSFKDISRFAINEFSNFKEEYILVFLIDEDGKLYKLIRLNGDIKNIELNQQKLLQMIIKNNIKKFIFSHNHVFTNEEPSLDDIEYYESLKEKCKILELCIIDYVIIFREKYFSFFNENIL